MHYWATREGWSEGSVFVSRAVGQTDEAEYSVSCAFIVLQGCLHVGVCVCVCGCVCVCVCRRAYRVLGAGILEPVGFARNSTNFYPTVCSILYTHKEHISHWSKWSIILTATQAGTSKNSLADSLLGLRIT